MKSAALAPAVSAGALRPGTGLGAAAAALSGAKPAAGGAGAGAGGAAGCCWGGRGVGMMQRAILCRSRRRPAATDAARAPGARREFDAIRDSPPPTALPRLPSSSLKPRTAISFTALGLRANVRSTAGSAGRARHSGASLPPRKAGGGGSPLVMSPSGWGRGGGMAGAAGVERVWNRRALQSRPRSRTPPPCRPTAGCDGVRQRRARGRRARAGAPNPIPLRPPVAPPPRPHRRPRRRHVFRHRATRRPPHRGPHRGVRRARRGRGGVGSARGPRLGRRRGRVDAHRRRVEQRHRGQRARHSRA